MEGEKRFLKEKKKNWRLTDFEKKLSKKLHFGITKDAKLRDLKLGFFEEDFLFWSEKVKFNILKTIIKH